MSDRYYLAFSRYIHLAETVKGLTFAREAHLGWSAMTADQISHVKRICSNNSTASAVAWLRSGAVDCILSF